MALYLSDLRYNCASTTGRPPVDLELMIRMLLVVFCFGIRSEHRLCEEMHFNLAYRWFCRLGLVGAVPDHSTFSKYRHGCFRDSDLLCEVFGITAPWGKCFATQACRSVSGRNIVVFSSG